MIARLLLTGVALCLGLPIPASGAQVSAPGSSQVVPTPFVGGPVMHTQLSRVGGRMRVTPMVPSQGSSDVVTFANTSWSGFYAVQAAGGEEWVDFGVKTGSDGSAGPDSLSISKLTVGYATTSPSASFTLTLYADTQDSCVPSGKGTVLLELPLTGLPGSSNGLPVAVIHSFNPADLLTKRLPAPSAAARYSFSWLEPVQ